MDGTSCPFCTLAPERVLIRTDLALVIRDAFSVSPGHTLIVPRRHVQSFFELSAAERHELLALVDAAKRGGRFRPPTSMPCC